MSARQNLARLAEIDHAHLNEAIKIAQKIFSFDDRSTKAALSSTQLKDKTNYLKVIANDPEENLIEKFFAKVGQFGGKAAPAPARKVASAPARNGKAAAPARKVAAAPARNGKAAPARKVASAPAGGSKKEIMLKLLARPSGASIDQITQKLEITPKAAHGVLYFLRQDGHNIEALGGGNFQLVEAKRRRSA